MSFEVQWPITGLDGAVDKSLTNGLVGTGFASRYWLFKFA